MRPSSPSIPTHPRLLVWLGPGADDHAAWQWATAGLGAHCARDRDFSDASARRRLRAWVGPRALVLQIVREPVAALRAEVQRARIAALAAHWVQERSARPAAHLVQLPTPETLYDRLLPLLHFERRGRAFVPLHGQRLVIDREELCDPSSRPLRRGIEDWLGPYCSGLPWEDCSVPADADLTEAFTMVSAGPLDVEGARLRVRLVRATELAARPDLVELARVGSIAARVPFGVDDTPWALVSAVAELDRLPRGIRQVLTATGLCQHRLEEQLLPRWIERTAQIHHLLGDDLPEVTPRLATRLREDLQHDLERLFLARPALEERWSPLVCAH